MAPAKEKPGAALRQLEALKDEYGGDAASRKLRLIRLLDRSRLVRASEVARLHETLCFLRAYPDDREILTGVDEALFRFDERKDLRRHREALVNSGIAGTPIDFPFYWFTASWLARRWPDRLSVDWPVFERKSWLDKRFLALMPYCETLALEETSLPIREWVERLKGPDETDATFLIRRFEALRADPLARELFYQELDVPCRLAPGPSTPTRSRARYAAAPIVFQKRPPVRSRSGFRAEIDRPPRAVRSLPPREAQAVIDLAREAMVTRHRDLDVFVHGDRRDVRMIDCGGGLQFACIGATPEWRQMLDVVYGFLMIRNGMPIGYVLCSALFGSAEVAFNVFDAYRGSEAAHLFGRSLAIVRHLFRTDAFVLDPYQLGYENREGQKSGAWWFYYKLGFRPRDPEILRLVRAELAKLKRNPRYRSSPSTLNDLAAENMYLFLGRPRDDVVGVFSRDNVGFRVIRYLAERFGGRREAGIRSCSREAARLLVLRSRSDLTAGERVAWDRWSPLVMALPGVERWSRAERTALARVVRAKGGRRESEFVHLFDRHRRLRRAILELANRPPD